MLEAATGASATCRILEVASATAPKPSWRFAPVDTHEWVRTSTTRDPIQGAMDRSTSFVCKERMAA